MHKIRVLVVAASLTGCATIMAGGPDKIAVQTNVPATVYLDGQPVGTTPAVVVLDRSKSQGNIRIEAPGYQPVVLQRSKEIQGWFWGNLCIGGLIGMVIDAVTGDMKKFDDSPINIALTPIGAGPSASLPPVAAR